MSVNSALCPYIIIAILNCMGLAEATNTLDMNRAISALRLTLRHILHWCQQRQLDEIWLVCIHSTPCMWYIILEDSRNIHGKCTTIDINFMRPMRYAWFCQQWLMFLMEYHHGSRKKCWNSLHQSDDRSMIALEKKFIAAALLRVLIYLFVYECTLCDVLFFQRASL